MSFFAKCKSLCGQWIRGTEGSEGVEFALIWVPFVYVTFAIIEISLFFAGANMLESGVNASARMIKTGQIQTGGGDQEDAFRQALCTQLFILVDCENVDLEVVPMPNNQFTDAENYQPQYDEDGHLISSGFNAGGANTVVLIRVAYRYQLWTPLFAQIFSTEPDHAIPLLTTVVLETEPYS